MTDASRRGGGSQTNTPGTDRSPTGSSGGRRSRGPAGTRRAGRREATRPPVAQPSFLERYRGPIIGVALVAIVGVVVVFLLLGATQPAYACDSQWTPAAAASSAAPDAGQPQPDMGRNHVSPGASVRYAYCPPASGAHYNAPPDGPIPARFYAKDDTAEPQGWIHNLEHGGIVVLYRCSGSDTCDTAQQQALQSLAGSFPPSPVCKLPPGGNSPSPVIARFDQMATPYAALVWGRVLPLQTLDTAAILRFYQAEGERTNPEPQCQTPGASPGMTLPASPSPS